MQQLSWIHTIYNINVNKCRKEYFAIEENPLRMNTVQKKIPMGKNPCREKFLRGNIPAGIFPHGENKNVNIYLKHTQMCQTDCKSEPKLDFRPLNRFLKIPAGIFSPKIPAGKNPRGEK